MSDSDDDVLTLLAIDPIGVQPFSARGLTQTLAPIAATQQLRRTINGTLHDTSAPQFRKYTSNIACTDQAPPAVAAAWPGTTLQVDCVARLSYKTAGGAPERTAVSGSSKVEGEFTSYRPRMFMKVTNYTVSEDEYGAAVAWSLDLEEV